MIFEQISTVVKLTFLYFFLLIPNTTHAQQRPDTLMPGDSLNYSQSRISPSGNFKLGFFSVPVGAESKSWYLGIWYNSISVQTVVWVANRRKALPEAGGLLSFASNGSTLKLTDSAGALFWSSSVAATSSSVPGVAQLIDSGNLVVAFDNGSYAWQSFDYPTDTLLPGMKLGWDRKSGLNRNLTSWKSPTDPSPGDYSMVMDLQGVPQVFVFTGTNHAPKWRAGPWNGQRFTGVPEMRSYNMFALQYLADRDEVVYTFRTTDPSVISRLVVNYTGTLQRMVWIGGAGVWNEFWVAPKDMCDAVNSCGAFGVCDTEESPVCSCVRGFQPKSPQEWYLRDGSGGCIRKTPLDCMNGTDGFAVVSGAKLPDTSNATMLPDKTMALDRCRAACLRNCSCTAYSAADITAGPAASGCILWAGDLTDVRTFGNGGQDLYVRVAQADLGDSSGRLHRRRVRLIIILVCTLAAATALAWMGWNCTARNKKRRKGKAERGLAPTYAEGSVSVRRRRSSENDGGLDLELPLFHLSAIEAATENFSEENKLGRGGFGSVYKGRLDNGQDVAVKRLGKNSMQGIDEFMNEITLIVKLQHRNLVRILGCCVQEEERILIYEYSPNRSLDAFLFDQDKATSLDWNTRYQIIMGIARGLVYLHHDSRLRIIHRDLKASNILLDKDMIPKISDFGMARIFGVDVMEENTQKVVGTYGYMSPEYAMDGVFSIKSDVFSFGVLVLEIISGKKNQGFYSTHPQQNLLSYVWGLWKEGKNLELVDKSIGTSFPTLEVLKCIKIGLLCVQERPEDRPTMSSVVFMLAADNPPFPQPTQPGFTITRGPFDAVSSSGKQDSCSVNDISLTMVKGR